MQFLDFGPFYYDTNISPPPETTTSLTPTSNCQRSGQMLQNPNDCASFYACLNDSCGTLRKVPFQCDLPNQSFDPVQRICTTNPVSGCTNNLQKPNCQYSDSSVTDPMDPTKYYLCVHKLDTVLQQVHRFCPPGLVFDEDSKMCICYNGTIPFCGVSMYSPNLDITDCLDESEVADQPFYAQSECVKAGTFADGYNCNRYYVCVEEDCGSFVKYGINCPKNTKFDAKRKICSSDPSVQCLCSCRNDTFECETAGLFADANCPSQYYECYVDESISINKARLSCPDGTYYNPKCQACTDTKRDKCDIRESCKENDASSSSSSSSSSSTEESESDSGDSCKGMKGKFPIKGEPDCYYVCKRGALVRERCPAKHIFDRHKKICRAKNGHAPTSKNKDLKKILLRVNVGSF